MWLTKVGILLFLAAAISAIPLLPEQDEDTTLSTDLKPPPLPEDGEVHAVLFLVNLYAVKNVSADKPGEEETEELQDQIMKDVPEITEPFATILLLVEEDDESLPVKLDEVAKDLEEEGFKVETIEKDGETKLIKVNIEIPEDKIEELESNRARTVEEIIKPAMNRRRKRSPEAKKFGSYGGGGGYGGGGNGGYGGNQGGGYPGGYNGGGGCNGGCGGGRGGGYYSRPVYRQPVQQHYPSGGCNTCGGNSGSYSQAQASAQASSYSYSG